MVQKDAKDILKEMKAEKEGVSPKDIQFKDLRKGKKRKKKVEKTNESESDIDIINNNEGFSITEMETKYCNYKDIGKKKKLIKKKNLEEWGAFDFFRFTHKLYLKKYKNEWDLNMGGSSLEINRIRDKFYDFFGFGCNLIMLDYIFFFFENHIDDFIRKEGDFYFSQMRKDWIMISFQEIYDFQKRFVNYMVKEKQKNKKYNLTKEEMKKSYDLGDMTLVGNYGVVLALNWLLKIKRKPKKEAIKIVVDACKSMHERNMLNIVKNATEIYSPYSLNFVFKSPQLVFNKIDSSIQLNVEFNNNNDKVKFLQKGNK